MSMHIFTLFVGLVVGLAIGLFIGMKAYARQRDEIDYALEQMDDNVVYISSLLSDPRISADAVRLWIANIRTDFTPSRRWRKGSSY